MCHWCIQQQAQKSHRQMPVMNDRSVNILHTKNNKKNNRGVSAHIPYIKGDTGTMSMDHTHAIYTETYEAFSLSILPVTPMPMPAKTASSVSTKYVIVPDTSGAGISILIW